MTASRAAASSTHPTASARDGLESVWRWARFAVAAGLLALLAFGPPRGPERGEPVRIDASTRSEALATLLADDPSATLIWQDTVAPSRRLTTLLAAGARSGGDVTLTLPEDAGALRVVAPHRPVAGRRAALQLSVRGDPDTDVAVTVTGQAGATDTVVVTTGADGRGSVSVAVEPTSAGAAAWTVRTPDAAATAHAWVRPARPVRVLVWSGTPGWESRYLLRALEAAGMDVAARQDLGRDLSVATEGAPAPTSLDDLSAYDVLALVGQDADAAGGLARRWVAERGGGLLLVGAGGGASALAPWAPRGTAIERAASELTWAGPAEIVPLPAGDVAIRTVDVPGSGEPVALSGGPAGGRADPTDGPAVLARASHVGRGRVFATGFESWPWAMEAGLGAEHRAFWTSVVDWLAGGLTEDATLDGEVGQPWVRWTGRLEGDVPAALVLTRPEGVAGPDGVTRPGGTRPGDARSVEAVSPGRAAGGATVVSFVPVAEGGHRLEASGSAGGEAAAGETAGGETSAAEPVLPAPTFGAVAAPSGEPMTWTAAALELGTAGARIVRSDDPARRDDARPTAPPRALTWLLFLGLAAGAVTAWATRRIAGRP